MVPRALLIKYEKTRDRHTSKKKL